MSRGRVRLKSNDARGAGRSARPASGGRSIRSGSLFLLVGVVGVVALLMLVSLLDFVLKPDPAVKAGPMYVTLILTTAASLLMFFLALNATYLPVLPRRQVPNFQLVMGAMGVTGVVTGLLTVGGAAGSYVTRLVFASLAYVFITVQDARLARARSAAPTAQAAASRPSQRADAPATKPRSYTRQRRGGRKR